MAAVLAGKRGSGGCGGGGDAGRARAATAEKARAQEAPSGAERGGGAGAGAGELRPGGQGGSEGSAARPVGGGAAAPQAAAAGGEGAEGGAGGGLGADGVRRGGGLKRRMGGWEKGRYDSEFEDEEETSGEGEEGSEGEGEVDFWDLGGRVGVRGRGEQGQEERVGMGEGGEEALEEEADAAEDVGLFQSYGLTWLCGGLLQGAGVSAWDQADALWLLVALPAPEAGDSSGLWGEGEGEEGVPPEVGIAHRHSNWEAFKSSGQGGYAAPGQRRGPEGLLGGSGGKLGAASETQQAQLLLSMQLKRMNRQRKLQTTAPLPPPGTPRLRQPGSSSSAPNQQLTNPCCTEGTLPQGTCS